ncbi:oligosaccharide flippase family protein [Kiloniella majae]|uniref:oligosaccharide flippase family protein n=1 Tax=Kiloniella majae TaxID=1938558 RepID=UPI000A2796DD|nr:oligosaccharide flippase family protein [Kiloniella majae]
MRGITAKIRLLKNSILLMSSMVLLRFFSAATTVVLTHWLTLEDYGRFSYGQSVALLVMFGVSVGLPTFIVKDVSAKTERSDELFVTCLKLISILGLIECSIIAMLFLLGEFSQSLASTVIPMSIGGGALAGNMVMQAFFRAYDRFALQAALLSLQGIVMLVILSLTAEIFDSSIAVAWAFAGCAIVLLGIHIVFAARIIRKITGRLIVWSSDGKFGARALLCKTISFGLIDWVMAGYPLIIGTGLLFLGGEALVGIFYAGFAVFGAVSIAALVLDQIFIREIVRLDKTQQAKMSRIYIFSATLAGLFIGSSLFFSANFLASIFFSETQPSLVVVLKVLSVALAFRFISLAASSFERLNDGQNKVLLFNLCGVGVLAFAMPTALQWGLTGAATSMVIFEACLAVIFVCRTFLMGSGYVVPSSKTF